MASITDGLKRFGKALAEGLAEAGDAVRKEEEKRKALEASLNPEVTLSVESLKQLKGMSCYQLEKIFQGKRVHLMDDPAVYRELKNFNVYQLEAIFGKEEKEG